MKKIKKIKSGSDFGIAGKKSYRIRESQRFGIWLCKSTSGGWALHSDGHARGESIALVGKPVAQKNMVRRLPKWLAM